MEVEHQGVFPKMSWDERMALIVWLRHDIQTEEFDRTLPGAFHRSVDEWMPAPWAIAESRGFAATSRRAAEQELAVLGISVEVSTWARDSIVRKRASLEGQRRELAALLETP